MNELENTLTEIHAKSRELKEFILDIGFKEEDKFNGTFVYAKDFGNAVYSVFITFEYGSVSKIEASCSVNSQCGVEPFDRGVIFLGRVHSIQDLKVIFNCTLVTDILLSC
ncbi:hypothetical protein EP331_00225 [bacterium]|nr:MAG: hypothetical protein EP331_00225 [bacterium]